MMNELLDLTKNIDPRTRATLVNVDTVISSLSIPYIVVGATARDLVLQIGYSTPIARATLDIDFALQVDSWDSFTAVKDKLLLAGFTSTKLSHRLKSPNNTPVDLVPFGKIEQKRGEIAWPPNGDRIMNVRGFSEANDYAQDVLIQKDPDVVCRVVSPEGLTILKLISWMDRARDLRGKDAEDIRYLMGTYLAVKNVRKDIYNTEKSKDIDRYEWDPDLAACCLLGRECQLIALPETTAEIQSLFSDDEKFQLLIADMKEGEPERSSQLLEAFADGFLNRPAAGQCLNSSLLKTLDCNAL